MRWLWTVGVVAILGTVLCAADKLYLDVKDDTFMEAGKIGLWSKAYAQSYFDDLTVEYEE